MDWIRVDSNLRHHPKTRKLGILLGKDRAHSYVIDLWSWCAQYALDGDLSQFDKLDICIAAGWDGDADVFISAMLASGFLDQDDTGLCVHDWHEKQGYLIEKRERDKERVRMQRERLRESRRTKCGRYANRTQTERKPSADVCGDERNERNVTNDTNNTPLPPSETFEQFWKTYPNRPSGKGSRPLAFQAWKKMSESERHSAIVAVPMFAECEQWTRDDGKYIPMVQTWLNQRRWENPPKARESARPWDGGCDDIGLTPEECAALDAQEAAR